MTTNTAQGNEEPEGAVVTTHLGEGRLERACRFLAELSLATAVVVVGVDILTRWLFRYSFEVASELGGYMLVAITFFSLCVSQANDGFHRVEIVQAKLPRRWQVASRIFFDVITLGFSCLLTWFYFRFVSASWFAGSVAPTYLMTPLWLAQLPLVLGMLAFIATLVKSIVFNVRRLHED